MIFSNYISIKKRSLMRSNQIIIEYTRISDFKSNIKRDKRKTVIHEKT